MKRKKYVLVTGASTGIGKDACRYLLEKGFSVIGTVRKKSDQDNLSALFPENFEAILLDVTQKDSIEAMGTHLGNKLKDIGLFGLVNNAGIAKGGPLMHVSDEEFSLQMNTNLQSIFRISNLLLPLMGAGFNSSYPPGRIINISSVSGLINTPMLGPYCISKHALESMSDIYRRELAVYGIKLVLIEPGPIKTPIWGKSVPSANPYKDTDFSRVYESFVKKVIKSEAEALPVETVSKLIYKGLTINNPSDRYIISKSKLMIKLIKNCMPGRWLDKLFLKHLRKQMHAN